jgi:hypothetical protein
MSDNDNLVCMCACHLVSSSSYSYISLFDNNKKSFNIERTSKYKCMTLESNNIYVFFWAEG